MQVILYCVSLYFVFPFSCSIHHCPHLVACIFMAILIKVGLRALKASNWTEKDVWGGKMIKQTQNSAFLCFGLFFFIYFSSPFSNSLFFHEHKLRGVWAYGVSPSYNQYRNRNRDIVAEKRQKVQRIQGNWYTESGKEKEKWKGPGGGDDAG